MINVSLADLGHGRDAESQRGAQLSFLLQPGDQVDGQVVAAVHLLLDDMDGFLMHCASWITVFFHTPEGSCAKKKNAEKRNSDPGKTANVYVCFRESERLQREVPSHQRKAVSILTQGLPTAPWPPTTAAADRTAISTWWFFGQNHQLLSRLGNFMGIWGVQISTSGCLLGNCWLPTWTVAVAVWPTTPGLFDLGWRYRTFFLKPGFYQCWTKLTSSFLKTSRILQTWQTGQNLKLQTSFSRTLNQSNQSLPASWKYRGLQLIVRLDLLLWRQCALFTVITGLRRHLHLTLPDSRKSENVKWGIVYAENRPHKISTVSLPTTALQKPQVTFERLLSLAHAWSQTALVSRNGFFWVQWVGWIAQMFFRMLQEPRLVGGLPTRIWTCRMDNEKWYIRLNRHEMHKPFITISFQISFHYTIIPVSTTKNPPGSTRFVPRTSWG